MSYVAEIGVRVATGRGSIRGDGTSAPENVHGMVIGHVRTYDIVKPDDYAADVILSPESTTRVVRQPSQRPTRSRPRRI